MTENYRLSDNKVAIVSRLSYLANKREVYLFLLDVYINDSESMIRTCAIKGILWAKGYLKNLNDISEFMQKKDFIKMFRSESIHSRKNIIEKFMNGDFEDYK